MAALKSMRIMIAVMAMVAASGSLAAQDRIEPASFLPKDGFLPRVVTIRGDRGGHVILYALRMREWLQRGTQVRFAGKCQSACTLYLGLSQEQTCISDGATFGFHSPYGVSGSNDRVAQDYMMRNYPEWVRLWIDSKGGLTRQMRTMPYDYASIFLRPCDNDVAKGDSGLTRLLARGELFAF
jgi:hypothetical protein